MKIDVAQRNTDLIEILNIKNYLYFECEVGKDLNIKDDIFVLNCITDHLSEHF